MTKVNTIDGSVNNHENGLVSENIRLKDEVTYLIKTCKNYEDRFVEMETEVQVSKKNPWKLPKGQLISKGLFGILNSPKKQTKTSRPEVS